MKDVLLSLLVVALIGTYMVLALALAKANHRPHPAPPEPQSGPYRTPALAEAETARSASWTADEQAWDGELTAHGPTD